MIGKFEIVKTREDVAMLRNSENRKDFRVVEINRRDGQVYSIGTDSPANGGRWFGSMSEGGIDYVSSPRSRRQAHRVFEQCFDF